MRSTIRSLLLAEFILSLALVAGCGGGESLKPSPTDGTPPPTSEREAYEKEKALHPVMKTKPGTGKTNPAK